MGPCFRARFARHWRSTAPANLRRWRFILSLFIASVFVLAVSVMLSTLQHEAATDTRAPATPALSLENRLDEQAAVAAESREAVSQLRRELEALREDYRTLVERHNAQQRELEATRAALRSLRTEQN